MSTIISTAFEVVKLLNSKGLFSQLANCSGSAKRLVGTTMIEWSLEKATMIGSADRKVVVFLWSAVKKLTTGQKIG